MDIAFYVAFFVTLVILMGIAGPISRWVRLPLAAMQILIGSACVYLVTLGLGIDTGLRAGNFHDLVFYLFLPVVVFQAAIHLHMRSLIRDIVAVILLAVVGLIATTLISAFLIYHGIGHPTGFPWAAALLTGTLLSATDPSAAVTELRRLGAPERLVQLLEGESLFNDALAIVLFTLCLGIALAGDGGVTGTESVLAFGLNFAGGIVVGLLGGGIATVLIRLNQSPTASTAMTLATAYGVFLTAELAFDVSGAMAALGAGMVINRGIETRASQTDSQFWDVLVYLANGCLFLLMGATITIAMFRERWLAMLIAICSALAARAIVVGGIFATVRPLLPEPLPVSDQGALVWGGVRGAVTLALALSLPVELDYWWTIQSMAFGVVLFTLLVQAPTLPLFFRRSQRSN